jgi:hypothetical protein
MILNYCPVSVAYIFQTGNNKIELLIKKDKAIPVTGREGPCVVRRRGCYIFSR